MEREACVCDHGYERSDLCAEIIIIIIIIRQAIIYSNTNSYYLLLYWVITYRKLFAVNYSIYHK